MQAVSQLSALLRLLVIALFSRSRVALSTRRCSGMDAHLHRATPKPLRR